MEPIRISANHRKDVISFLTVVVMLSYGSSPNSILRLQSRDLGIGKGSEIRIDGKTIGIAPCKIALTTNKRHKIELKKQNGTAQTYFLTVKTLKKSELIDNIPAWFLNPTLPQPDFPDHENLTQATATSATISDARSSAETEVKGKLAKGSMSRYFTFKEVDSRSMLDSGRSRYYPKLTRGQMDSLNDVNGGRMVARSFGDNASVEFLEYEIQKVDHQYQVYVLAGSRKQ